MLSLVHSVLNDFQILFICLERFGKGLLAGASGAGLLALCYYGLGMSGEESAADRALWVFIIFICT